MKKKLNEIIYASIVMSVFFLVMGILLVVNPEISLDVISYMIATFLIINGIFLFVLDFKLGGLLIFFDNIISGVISVVLGILVLINPSLVSTFIPVVVGIWFIIVSIFKIRLSLLFDDDSKGIINNTCHYWCNNWMFLNSKPICWKYSNNTCYRYIFYSIFSCRYN